MKLGVFTVLFGNRAARGSPRSGRRGRHRRASRSGPATIRATRTAGRPSCSPTTATLRALPRRRSRRAGSRSARSRATATRCIRRREVARASHDTFVADRGARAAAGRRSGQPLQRLPGRLGLGPLPELGDLRLAERVRRAARVAMAREGHPVLAGAGRVCRRATACGSASRCIPDSSSTTRRTLLRLREACGEAVGANLDPSHLFWQGIDIETAIAELGRRARSSTPTPRTRRSIPPTRRSTASSTPSPLGEVGRPVLDLPDRRLRAWRARLATDPQRAPARRLRRRPLDRARGRAAVDRRGLPQGRRLPAVA